jgi:hypothetical protein
VTLKLVTEEILQLRIEKRRCEQIIAEHSSGKSVPMELQETEIQTEQTAKWATAKSAVGGNSKHPMGAVSKSTNQQTDHIRTISSSSSEEEVASKCTARSNESDAPAKVINDYEIDYGTFSEIPKAMKNEINEDIRASHAGEEP